MAVVVIPIADVVAGDTLHQPAGDRLVLRASPTRFHFGNGVPPRDAVVLEVKPLLGPGRWTITLYAGEPVEVLR